MPDIKELGRLTKLKYPQYAGLSDEEVGRKVKARFPNEYAQFTDTPTAQPSAYERFKTNIGLGVEQAGVGLSDQIYSLYEAAREGVKGNFQPLKEVGQGIVQGINRGVALANANPVAALNAERSIEEARQATQQRRLKAGDIYAQGRAIEGARLEREAAKDPSLTGRATRAITSAALQSVPAVGAGIINPVAGAVVSGLQSFDSPADLPQNVVFGGLGSGARKVASQAVERVLGKGAAQIAEAEAVAVPRGVVTGAVADQAKLVAAAEAAANPSAGLNAAIAEAVKEVPQSFARRALGELSAAPRALMSSLDISAPGRQGLLLSVRPSNWGAAIKAGGRMFQAFGEKSYRRISEAIATHPDAALAEQSGLYLALRGGEELFVSKLASKFPGVVRSQRMYETYLDSLRISTFSKYKAVIDKAGLTAEQLPQAYEAAAKWINIATGRGSLGKNFENAVPLLSQFLFAPRYTASRLNILNPAMYYQNFKNPATRVVAREQMKDLASYISAFVTTAALAKAAGADVGLNPNDGDFLKIRAGGKTYDPGAGLVQVMRFAIRTVASITRSAKGEKQPYGQDAASLISRFIRSKTAPVPSYAWDFFSGRTYEGKNFDAFKGAYERVVPLQWADFVDALYTEGWASALGTLPGALGIGVQDYNNPNGGFVERAQPLLTEYTRFERQIPEIRKAQGETDADFNARTKVFGEAMERFGNALVASDEYKRATDEQKRAALELLPRRINGALLRQGEVWQLRPAVLLDDVKETQELRRGQQPRQLFDVNGVRIR